MKKHGKTMNSLCAFLLPSFVHSYLLLETKTQCRRNRLCRMGSDDHFQRVCPLFHHAWPHSAGPCSGLPLALPHSPNLLPPLLYWRPVMQHKSYLQCGYDYTQACAVFIMHTADLWSSADAPVGPSEIGDVADPASLWSCRSKGVLCPSITPPQSSIPMQTASHQYRQTQMPQKARTSEIEKIQIDLSST